MYQQMTWFASEVQQREFNWFLEQEQYQPINVKQWCHGNQIRRFRRLQLQRLEQKPLFFSEVSIVQVGSIFYKFKHNPDF